MKVKVTWIADNQGRQERVIEAINVPAAESQAKVLYGSLPGYTCIGVNVINETRPNQELTTHVKYANNDSNVNISSWELRDFVGYVILCSATLSIFFGLLILPLGIIPIVLGIFLWWATCKWNT